jgi:hypothetical protein
LRGERRQLEGGGPKRTLYRLGAGTEHRLHCRGDRLRQSMNLQIIEAMILKGRSEGKRRKEGGRICPLD